MRKQLNSNLVLFFVLLGSIALTWRIYFPLREVRLSYLDSVFPSLQSRKHGSRLWRAWTYKRLAIISNKQDPITPAYLQSTILKGACFFDPRLGQVKQILSSGDIVILADMQASLAVAGMVPVTGVAFAPEGTIWLSNPSRAVTQFNMSGSLKGQLRSIMGMRIALMEQNLAVTVMNSSYALTIYNTTTSHSTRVGRFVKDQARIPAFLDGALASDPANKAFLYAPTFNSFIAAYDETGFQKFLVATVDTRPLPVLPIDSTGMIHTPEYQNAIESMMVNDDKIFMIVKSSKPGNSANSILDVYAASTGQYLYSQSMPGSFIDIALTKDKLYMTTSHTIEVWSLPDRSSGTTLN